MEPLSGISPAGFLQLVELEYLSCVAEITDQNGNKGYVYCVNGALYNAYDGKVRGEEAALNLLRLEHVHIRFKSPSTSKRCARMIHKDIQCLIDEAYRG